MLREELLQIRRVDSTRLAPFAGESVRVCAVDRGPCRLRALRELDGKRVLAALRSVEPLSLSLRSAG